MYLAFINSGLTAKGALTLVLNQQIKVTACKNEKPKSY